MASKPVVLCLGDSHTFANLGGSWVNSLAAALPEVTFVNTGVNGTQTVNIHASLDKHLSSIDTSRLAGITLLVGTNDCLLSLGDDAGPGNLTRKYYSYSNGYNGPANVDAYKEQLLSLLTALRGKLRQSDAGVPENIKVMVITLPPIGEVLGDRANSRVDQYNAVIRDVVARQQQQLEQEQPKVGGINLVQIDLNARCKEAIATAFAQPDSAMKLESPSTSSSAKAGTIANALAAKRPRPLSRNFFVNSYRIVSGGFRRHVLGTSFDRQSDLAGTVVLTPDCIHLNDRGAELLRVLVEPHVRDLVVPSK